MHNLMDIKYCCVKLSNVFGMDNYKYSGYAYEVCGVPFSVVDGIVHQALYDFYPKNKDELIKRVALSLSTYNIVCANISVDSCTFEETNNDNK